MEPPDANPDAFFHVRIVIGMVTGLGLTRLLSGLARFVQARGRAQADPVHLGWTAFLLLALMHFWWFEFALGGIPVWTFGLYSFLVGYAALYFFTAAVLYPDQLGDFPDYRRYFEAHRGWFYGLLIALVLADTADTLIKGAEHVRALGPAYALRQTLMVGAALAAMRMADRRFDAGFVLAALLLELGWILWRYRVLA